MSPTVDDPDGPNTLCGKCWGQYVMLRAEVERLKAEKLEQQLGWADLVRQMVTEADAPDNTLAVDAVKRVRIQRDTLRAEVERLSNAEELAHAEVERLKADIAAWPVCEDHKPDKWEGGKQCVVCEAHDVTAERNAALTEVERLRRELSAAGALLDAHNRSGVVGIAIDATMLAERERDALRAVLEGLVPRLRWWADAVEQQRASGRSQSLLQPTTVLTWIKRACAEHGVTLGGIDD